MNTLTLAIVLQTAGVLVIIAEIIIPSGGILSLIAAGLFGYSLYTVFSEISTGIGMAFVAADVVMIPVLVVVGLKMLARSPVTLREQLSSKSGVTSQAPGMDKYLDMEGRALTSLHPAGTAMVEGKRLDVVTRGEFVDKGSKIIVIEVAANRIVVKQKEEA